MRRQIICLPECFGGAPHIEGTDVTVQEVQEYWRQPGIGAVEARSRFPQLSESELGAAVTYVEPREPRYEFIAQDEGPPRRRFYIEGGDEGEGWRGGFDAIDQGGLESPGMDWWEETFSQIIRYPEGYASKPLQWADAKSGEMVDLKTLRL